MLEILKNSSSHHPLLICIQNEDCHSKSVAAWVCTYLEGVNDHTCLSIGSIPLGQRTHFYPFNGLSFSWSQSPLVFYSHELTAQPFKNGLTDQFMLEPSHYWFLDPTPKPNSSPLGNRVPPLLSLRMITLRCQLLSSPPILENCYRQLQP